MPFSTSLGWEFQKHWCAEVKCVLLHTCGHNFAGESIGLQTACDRFMLLQKLSSVSHRRSTCPVLISMIFAILNRWWLQLYKIEKSYFPWTFLETCSSPTASSQRLKKYITIIKLIFQKFNLNNRQFLFTSGVSEQIL